MYRTKEFLKSSVSTSYMTLTLEEIASKYQIQPDIALFSTAFYKVFNLCIDIQQKYWGLNEDDVASWCLEKLDYCLKTYKTGNKFSTYFYKVFFNKLREETEALNYKKRKGVLVSINELLNTGIEDTYNFLELLLPKGLTDKEYKYCLLASDGYDKKYIADELQVSRMTICNIEKSLRNKLFTLQN